MSVLFFGIGTAHAVFGLNDNVPGEDIVIPFICQVGTGTLDTQWAIAEVDGINATATVYYFNQKSEFVTDEVKKWTAYDVFSDGCKNLISRLGTSSLFATELTTTVTENGTPDSVYVGYAIYINDAALLNQFVSWVYLNDIPNGFNAGFDGYDVEDGVDIPVSFPFVLPSELNEDGWGAPGIFSGITLPYPIADTTLIPRYYFFNTNAGTFNWWIILKGGPTDPNHLLSGDICNEDEGCLSFGVDVPYNLNIIDVEPIIPTSIFVSTTGIPGEGGGFAVLTPETSGIYPAIVGFVDEPCLKADAGIIYGDVFPYIDQSGNAESCIDSTIGWAYQRAATGTVVSNWDVAHEMHAIHGYSTIPVFEDISGQ